MTEEALQISRCLPKELVHRIVELGLTPYTHEEYYIDHHYRHPSLLQVNHYTQQKFARTYYSSNATFVVHPDYAIRWFGSLTEEHQRMLLSVKIRMDKAARRLGVLKDSVVRAVDSGAIQMGSGSVQR